MLKPKHTAQTLIQLRGEFVKGFRKNEPYMVLAQGFTVFTTHTESESLYLQHMYGQKHSQVVTVEVCFKAALDSY